MDYGIAYFPTDYSIGHYILKCHSTPNPRGLRP